MKQLCARLQSHFAWQSTTSQCCPESWHALEQSPHFFGQTRRPTGEVQSAVMQTCSSLSAHSNSNVALRQSLVRSLICSLTVHWKEKHILQIVSFEPNDRHFHIHPRVCWVEIAIACSDLGSMELTDVTSSLRWECLNMVISFGWAEHKDAKNASFAQCSYSGR